MRLLALAVAALAALLLTVALASAQEPPESQTATRLEPGLNLVGWVGESTSVSQLFNEIPQLESIWAWDAELDDWIVAGRDAPEWLGGLGRVTAGMGLRLVLGGEEPFLWQRPTEPTRGLVELRTGWNLVAWSGADGAPIEQVAKGIGWSLRELRRWNAANQQWTAWTSPERSAQLIATSATDQGATDEEAKPPTARRGEALWVNTTRSVNWLQPTDILPRLIFPGGASDALQSRVREDLESVLAFYGQQYGIQADPDFTVYIPKDVEALIQAQKGDSEAINDVKATYTRGLWSQAGGWAGGEEIVVKQTSWPGNLPASDISWARYTLTHEYFHILQRQLSVGWATQWLVEGTATWAANDHQVIDGSGTWEEEREWKQSGLSSGLPALRSFESRAASGQYTLGWLAVDRLATAAGDGSYIEFWRRLISTKIGPHGRWISTPDWRTAFQETFGVSVSSFYADFNAWQREQAAANEATTSPGDDDVQWIRGRVTDENGAFVVGVFVNAIRVEGSVTVGWRQLTETDADGTFAVRALEDGDYRISVDIADDCTRYYGNGAVTAMSEDARLVEIAGANATGVDLRLPSNTCGWFIRGQIVDGTGQPLAGVFVNACGVGAYCTQGNLTTLDGSFAVPATTAGDYYLTLNLVDGCFVYLGTAGVAPSLGGVSFIAVSGRDVLLSPHQIPAEMCAHGISGRLLKADGAPFANGWMNMYGQGWPAGRGVATDANGRFEVRAPSYDAYQFRIQLRSEPHCWRDLEGQARGSPDNPVRVSGADVTNIVLRLPGTIEELCG